MVSTTVAVILHDKVITTNFIVLVKNLDNLSLLGMDLP